jgi:hypothetical protein
MDAAENPVDSPPISTQCDAPVARLEAVLAEPLQAVADDDAEIGDEMGDAAHVLGNQPALGIEQGAAIILHLIDHHIVGGALQIDRHFAGDGG